MAKIEGAAMAELPGIPAPKRSRGRPSTGHAKTAAQRKQEQRFRDRSALWGSSQDGGREAAEWTAAQCLTAIQEARSSSAMFYFAVKRLAQLRGWQDDISFNYNAIS